MCPIPHPDGYDFPWLIDELVPCEATVIDDIVVGFEDPVGQPVIAHELPDVFDGVQFRRFRWQRRQRDIVWNFQSLPSGLIDDKDRVGCGRNSGGDILEMQVHGFGVASG